MPREIAQVEKVYITAAGELLDIHDMLTYFEKQGVMRVSDLHIKIGTQPAYRVDGNLLKMKGQEVSTNIAEALILPLLSDENKHKLEQKRSVDCSYSYSNLQFRINVFMENDGLCAAIRALGMEVPKVEEIGFPNSIWKDIVNRKHGLVLLTGITGAGKSTTIASLIGRISERRASRIITIEDPIEYVFKQKNCMISQREIGRDVGSFNEGLRSMMREDPDIIFVGEMRDAETIEMTLMAAETGHLVFSTLHTRDVTGTVARIMDYFPPARQNEVRNQLSLSLAYVISQKLVPKKDGSGRVVAMEILNNNYACANLIRTGKMEQLYTVLQTRTKDNPDERMVTFEKHLASLVKTNKVDMLEAQKWVNNLASFVEFVDMG
jgi:twitching motility protein PilT